jgi:renalase
VTTHAQVAVVGAGIAGVACAQVLREARITVDLIERGRVPGGRLASPTLHNRRVDLGAAYFTVKDDDFAAQVEHWCGVGLAREWTDTLDKFGDDGRGQSSGPMRYAAIDGLRSLVRDLVAEVTVASPVTSLDELEHEAVVLAMPDPQAARLAGAAVEWVDYDPVIAVAAGWDERCWTLDAAAFVNDDPDITLIADDGARRGDGAPVLVIHATSALAGGHLDDPNGVIAPVVGAARRLLDIDSEPAWTHAHRWTFAKPTGTHGDAPFALIERDGGLLGICGDSWCPSGAPRVESAWLSGRRLGHELARRLAN